MKSSNLTPVLIALTSTFKHSYALVLHTVIATSTSPNHGLQWNLAPQTTTGPGIAELRARQASQTALATCGFIDGDADKPVTCRASLYCATTSTFVGCCELSECRDIYTTCYDLLGSTCDQACQNDAENLVCPTSLPYCARYEYEGGSVGLGCAAVQGYTTTVLLTTGTTFGALPPPSSTSSATNNTTLTSPASSATSSSSSGLSTGATAGIAVGAVLGGIAIAVVAWLLYRRRKKPEPNVAAVVESKEEPQRQPDRRSKALSELPSSPRTPMSPDFLQNAGYGVQPSPGPPHYTQEAPRYEMPGSSAERPISYAPTELSSSRG